jgi:CAAX prenyl protease-like protein
VKNEPAVVRCAPFGLYIALLVLGPWLEAVLPDSVDARWLYAVQVGMVTGALALLWRRYGELRGAPAPGWAGWVLGVGAGVAVFFLWINLDVPPLVIGDAGEGFDPRVDGSIDWRLATTRLAGATLVVPVMEELFWRSFIMRWLERQSFSEVDPAVVGWKALVISSAVFAVEHHLWFAGLLAGLAYGWIYIRTRNLWVPIVAHAVTNGLLGVWVLQTGAWGFW